MSSRRSGRPRKPLEYKRLTKTFRQDRHGHEVSVPAQWPDPPAHLNARERELWGQLEPHCRTWVAASDWLVINGVVSLVDRVLTIQDAQRKTDDAGQPLAFKYTPSADGEPNLEPKENPLYGMELKTWRELRAFIGLMGLSPVDRAKVQKAADGDAKASPLDRFIKRAG